MTEAGPPASECAWTPWCRITAESLQPAHPRRPVDNHRVRSASWLGLCRLRGSARLRVRAAREREDREAGQANPALGRRVADPLHPCLLWVRGGLGFRGRGGNDQRRLGAGVVRRDGPVLLVNALIAFLYLGAGKSLQAVVDTQHEDVPHLLDAMGRLGGAFRIETILGSIGIIAGAIGLYVTLRGG